MRKISTLLCFLIIFLSGCATRSTCNKKHVKETPYSSKELVEKELKSHKNEVVRLLFEAPWCGACNKLDLLMKQAEVEKKVLRLNMDETWAFISSKQLGVSSVPTMVELRRGKPPVVIEGANKIVMRLLIK